MNGVGEAFSQRHTIIKEDIFFIIRGGKVNYMCKSRNVSCGKQKVEEDSFNDMSCLYGYLP